MNADGSGGHALVDLARADERYPVFSPDGTRFAFTSSRDGGQYDVYVASADGSGQTRLTTDPGYDSAPSWSPDAKRLAFERGTALDVDTTKDIWIMDADGAGQTRLTNTAGVVDEGPAFFPDGTQIAFTSGRDGNYEIYRMGSDGSAQTRVLGAARRRRSRPTGRRCRCRRRHLRRRHHRRRSSRSPARTATATACPRRVRRRCARSDLDRDSDDDGVSDGREVRSVRTRADRFDTDRDGLSDGVETGVTRRVADPAGPLRGTAILRFRADRDPRTRTDPRRSDTRSRRSFATAARTATTTAASIAASPTRARALAVVLTDLLNGWVDLERERCPVLRGG